ncbi:unnamed protein product [Phytomonas sp. Hart1]|nr:unnamed protein product [Phytomonas sp. Hart1]|eukprot:CCW72352.1 unnamed protein product [Phytomonas sp. isolate Hart1]
MRRYLSTLTFKRVRFRQWTQACDQMEMNRRIFATTVLNSKNFFGNAPARVRPVETSMGNGFRQTEQEITPLIVIAFVIIATLWLLPIFSAGEERKRKVLMQWALARQQKES